MSLPFAEGRLEVLQGLEPSLLSKDIRPLLALCAPDDVRRLLTELDRSACEMTPCRADLCITSSSGQKCLEFSGVPEQVEAEPGVFEWDGFLQENHTKRLNEQRDENARKLEAQADELKAAQHQLKTAETYRGMIHSAPDGMIVIDQSGTILLMNAQFQRMFGYAEQELLGQSIDLLVPPAARASQAKRRSAFIRTTLKTNRSHPIPNIRACRKDTSEFDADVTLSALPTDELHAPTICVAIRDVTARRLAEKQLRQALDFSEGIINTLPDILFEVDRNGRYLKFWTHTSDMSPERTQALLGKTVHDILAKDTADAAMAAIREADEKGQCSGHVLRVDQPDGTPLWYEHSLAKKRGVTKELDSFIVLSRDVTARINAEAALNASESRARAKIDLLNSIIDSSPEVIVFALDRDYRYLAFNRLHVETMRAIWGKDIQRGMSMLDVIGAHEDRKTALRAFDRALAGESFVEEAAYGDEALSRKHWQTFWSPIRSEAGEISGLTCFVLDISERRRMEEELRLREQYQRTLLDNFPFFVWLKDEQSRLLAANNWYARMVGAASPCELEGKTDFDLFPQALAEKYVADDREVMAAGRTKHDEEMYVDEHGKQLWTETWKSPLVVDGKIVGTVGFSRDITARRETESYAEKTHQHLHSVLQTIPDLIWLKNIEGVYLACNHAFEKFFGAEEIDIVGKTDYDFVDKDLADFFREKDRAAVDAGSTCINEEWVTYAASGERGLLETRKVPVHGADGKIIGVLGVARDITERKRMEEELRRREQYQRTLLDNFPFLVWLKDEQSLLLAANVEFARTVGAASPLELEGKSDFELFPHDLATQYIADDKEVMESGVPKHLEEPFVDAHGNHLWIETWKSPLVVDGKTLGTVGFFRDITKRKEIELRLEETRWLLHSVLQGIPDPVWMKDANGAFLICNQGVARLLNTTVEAIIGKTDHDFFDAELANFYQQKDRTAMEAGQVRINDEWWTFGDNGERALMETRKVPVKGTDGRFLGVLGVARDITERKRIEESLGMREREFRTLVENTPDTVARFGPNLRRKFVNPALAKFLGKDAEELLGKTTIEVPGGAPGELAATKLMEVFRTGQPLEFEYLGYDKDGNETCSLMRMAPEFNSKGEVESVLSVGRDITEMNAFRYKIHQMAFFDTLTNLPNRALFNDRLGQMITDAAWHGQSAGLMMIDMDRFKTVNDTMGHAVGDELLCEAARRLTECVRSYDTVARLGGDEFAVILPDIRSGADLGRVASKMLEKFDERFLLDGKDIFVSCSIGIAIYPNDGTDGQDLLKFADSAMYYAKRSGRNNFRFYAKDLTTTAQERLTLEQNLRQAIVRGELELHYQPKVSLHNGKVIGSEALLRWRHPQQGMIPPGNFIQIAEDTGLIVEIGLWVLREACRVAAAWNAHGQAEHKIAINLSPRQFQSPHLIRSVRQTLEATGCRPEWIELEITEGLLLEEDGQVLDVLRAFRDMGISIAIDDFGTGYSALSYLARFPIDTLKIDRSFISAVTTDHYRAELVRAILSIARCLGQEVVAEGVETVEQAAFLAAYGCQIAQGFLYSKAVPESEFILLPKNFSQAPH